MRDKKETLDKENKKLKFKKIAKKQKLQEQGITLIALVVTIIILLILVGVTLNIALSDNGLFNKTKKAAEEYKQAQNEEEDEIRQISTQMYNEYVGATVTGYELNAEKMSCTVDAKINDSENATTFTRDNNINWRVWDYDGNTLRIIGDTTSKTLTLKGAAGYNNGVWAIDYICGELYSNGKSGVTATNLKRTDIQKVSTYDYTKYKHMPNTWLENLTDDDSNSIYFGATKTYENYNQYPTMWEENDRNWTYEYNKDERGKKCSTWEVEGNGEIDEGMKQGSNLTVFKQSYYYHIYNKNEFLNDQYYDLIFKKTDGTQAGWYYIAGRYVFFYEESCEFGLQVVCGGSKDSYVHGVSMCNSKR